MRQFWETGRDNDTRKRDNYETTTQKNDTEECDDQKVRKYDDYEEVNDYRK